MQSTCARDAKTGSTDPLVSAEVAKEGWFLRDEHLLLLASWSTESGATHAVKEQVLMNYKVSDLDRLALKVHGAGGLARKRDKRRGGVYRKEG